MYFVGEIYDIFHPQYLDLFKIVFICKVCKTFLYELIVTTILDMPCIYVVLSVRLAMFFPPTTRCFNVISFVRGPELCSHITFLKLFYIILT